VDPRRGSSKGTTVEECRFGMRWRLADALCRGTIWSGPVNGALRACIDMLLNNARDWVKLTK
jgi:hypothetical protein